MKAKTPSGDAETDREPPTSSELAILAVLWQAAAEGAQALRLSEIRDRLLVRFGKVGQPTTISTQLRALLRKGWLDEIELSLVAAVPRVRVLGGPRVVRAQGRRGRPGAVPSRSPFTAYRPAQNRGEPSEAIQPLLRDLAAVYPVAERYRLLLDACHVLGLPAETIALIEQLVVKRP